MDRDITWFLKRNKSIAYINHLYTQVVPDREADELEKWLDSEYEHPATLAIEKAVSNKKLSVGDWEKLIKFLASQDVRTPTRLYEHIQRFDKCVPEAINSAFENLKEKLIHKEFAHDQDPKKAGFRLPMKLNKETTPDGQGVILKIETYSGRSSWLNSIRYLLENTSKVLLEHKWTIVKPAKGFKWFTSDNPVVKLNFSTPKNYDLRGGWGQEKGNIFFPISPEYALFVEIGNQPPQKYTRLSIEQTHFLRKIVAENANRMIFSDNVDSEIEKFLPRLVDMHKFRKEEKAFENWHDRNKELEIEYNKNKQE
ncbi:MAG: DUF4238 domain-containing protein [Candidatus Electrothrix sp. AR4]|nr:DUF4238 domain-containing protein [Candidatus Electrothrix sp. AR4]